MKQIEKYIIKPGMQQIMIPSESILSVGCYKDDIVLYALTDTDDVYERPYEIIVYKTNQQIDADIESYNFIGTAEILNGNIFHVFFKGMSSIDF